MVNLFKKKVQLKSEEIKLWSGECNKKKQWRVDENRRN